MPEWLLQALADGPAIPAQQLVVRLLAALVLGVLVALVYRYTRGPDAVAPSFTVTLVLLAILIAMVTQVIGDNVARAFSLVGALSIVRFRTVVRDTQDTAYVIFAVAVGMAVGAGQLAVGVAGIAVVGLAAALMMRGSAPEPEAAFLPFLLRVRVGLGHNADTLLAPALAAHTVRRRLVGLSTARQGVALDVSYRAELEDDGAADALVKALNRIEGVQTVTLERPDPRVE
jgi:hypothetical protein